ncbi:MAG: dienelactone hydrolase family protein [Candidatus Hydrogenedentes bacterium]|nr:dienelactone hydrolase family protein [Candidatus Hydrogenedentota bacterium]
MNPTEPVTGPSFDERPDALTRRFLGLGPFPVHVVPEVEIHDERRGKDVPLKIYMPDGGGAFPAILFSHGAGDSNDSSPHLMRQWASHGYVVLLPTHYFGERPLIERSLHRLGKELLRPITQGPSAWNERTDDMRLVLDTLPRLHEHVPGCAGRVDTDRIGIAGHSFGAYTALLLAGATLVDKEGATYRFADPRPRAFLVISGPGRDTKGLTSDSFRDLSRPMMVLAGSHDPPPDWSLDPMWRTEPYAFAPDGDKYLAYLRGANHMSYIGPLFDIPLRDPARRGTCARVLRRLARYLASFAPPLDQVGIFDYTRIVSVAFWDAYLKDSPCARMYLRSAVLEHYSRHTVKLDYK